MEYKIAALNFLSANLTLEQMKEIQNWTLKAPKFSSQPSAKV